MMTSQAGPEPQGRTDPTSAGLHPHPSPTPQSGQLRRARPTSARTRDGREDPNALADLDDKALLAAHVAGDPQAFSVLFGRHADRLWTLAVRTLRQPEEAEEVVQEAMLSAFRRAAEFRGEAAVSSWLHRIVLNACFDRLRRAKARPSQPLEDELLAVLASPAPGPEEATLRAELALEVERALAAVTVDQRAALMLVDMQGYSTDDAAEILGCAPGTVKSRCSRGRAKLAPLLRHLLEA